MRPLEIKVARIRKGLTQSYMAERLEVSVTSYRKKENGQVRFTDEEKITVAKELDLSLEQFNDYFYNGKLPAGVIAAHER